MKILYVIEKAFRATVEEQDDTILWLARNLRSAGADFEVLLAANAVRYAVETGIPARALRLGAWQQAHPASPAEDVRLLVGQGVACHVLQEDLDARGIDAHSLQPGVRCIGQREAVALYERADQVWQW